MKIQILSDLHYEINRYFTLQKEDFVGDVIILAGDICDMPGSRFEHLPDIPVIHVLGNHEHYGKVFNDTKDRISRGWRTLGKSNVQVLNNEVHYEGYDTRFLCTTLWTNFVTEHGENQAAECRRGMNDFYQIREFSLARWMDEHERAVAWLKEELTKGFSGKTVVVTHHAPSFKSNSPKYGSSTIRAGFCVDLEYLMQDYSIDLWIHGHTHEPSDYMVSSTRVVCNPLGYGPENPRFQESLVVEI